MSPTSQQLSPGFVTVEEACELIKKDTRQVPVVDMDYLVSRTKWIEVSNNFRIPKIRRLAPEEVYQTRRGKTVEFENTGEVNVYIGSAYEAELLKKTIADKYKELVGHEYQSLATKAVSTVADDAQGKDAVRPRANKPIAKEGASIGSGETITTNGEGLTV